MKLAFAGTPEFARCALAALSDAGHEVVLVLSQPDRPAGRGLGMRASPVKLEALSRGLPLIQPRSLRLDGKFADEARRAQQALADARPEVLVVAAYGLILPVWALHAAPHGSINIHASLLPRWRGAAPIQRAIEAGDDDTGITLMRMDEGLDTGPILVAESVPIEPDDDSTTLHDRLAQLGARLVVQHLPAWVQGRLKATAQPESGVTYARKIDKAEARIDWRRPAVEIERRLRAFDPFPGANFVLEGEPVKLWRARVVAGDGEPGRCLASPAGTLRVACGVGALELLELQRAGGRRLRAADFLRSTPMAVGASLAG